MTTGQTRMATLKLDPQTYGLIQSALLLLPRKVYFRTLRRALNAWGGVVRDKARSLARRQTGLLAKSLKVKAVIPDASFNVAHHGKPPYVMVGPSRDVVGPVSAGRLLSIRKATKRVLSGGHVQTRRPSRYAHLIERGHKNARGGMTQAYPFIGPAAAAGETAGMEKVRQKIQEGIYAEAAALPKA